MPLGIDDWHFRPRWVPFLPLFVPACVCAGLGVWQLDRAAQKRGLADELAARSAAEPLAIGDAAVDAHRYMSNLSHVVNVTGICYFAVWVYGVQMIQQFMEHATGESYTMDDLLTIGERIATMRMAFNEREGVSFSDRKVPGRMIGDPPLQAGPLKGVTIGLKTQTDEFCASMGWDPLTGRPSREKLKELGLDRIVSE